MQTKWLAMCVIVGLGLLGVVAAVEGFTKWTLLLAALLLVCPVLGVWVMRQNRDPARRNDMSRHSGQ